MRPAGKTNAAPTAHNTGPHGAHPRPLEPVAHARHPLLLARHAGPYPQHVRTVGVDALHDLLLLVRLEVAERRRVAADDPDAGEVAPGAGEGRRLPADDPDAGEVASQVQGELRERPLVAPAVQPDAVALLGAA